jgi:2-C-methyl-D-erythritol 4-phosphate cytidylyltransferase
MTVVVGIVPAGGSGERLGAERPKAFIVVGGKPMLEYSLDALRGACDRTVVAAPSGRLAVGGWQSEASVVEGGPSRSASVRNAVLSAPEADVFIVHDAARPLVTPELVARCLAALEGFDGAIAAAPVTDTVKEAGRDGRVLRTLDRSSLWAVQTPQVFRADLLRHALDVDESVLASATDDASLVEAAGGSVRVVAAPPENLKVTGPADLRLVEALLGAD